MLILFLSLLILGITGQSAQADSNDIKLSVEQGFAGKIKSGHGFPVKITIENSGADFRGDVLINYSASYNTSGAKAISVDVPKGTAKTYTLSLPAMSEDFYSGRQITQSIFLYSGNWQQGHEQNFRGDKILKPKFIDRDAETLGILSEDGDRLKELKLMPTPTAMETIVLTEEMLPDEGLGLETLDYLLIDEYPIAKLKKTQQEAILKWVQNGGILIAGAAPNAEGIYGSLYASLPMKADQEVVADTSFFQLPNKKELKDKQIPFFIGAIEKDAEVDVKSKKLPAIVHKDYGSGEIWQTAFSLGDEPLSSWNGYAEWLAGSSLLSGSGKWKSSQGGGPDPYDMIFSEFAEINEYFSASHFSIGQISIMLILYLLLIIPVLYLILKRLDKREHAWWTILCFAFLSSAVIFAIGAKDRLAKPQLNQMGIFKAEGNQLSGYEAITFLSNTGGDYEVNVTNGELYGVPGASSMVNSSDGKRYAVIENGRKADSVTFPNVEYWSARTYFGQAFKKDAGSFAIKLDYKNKRLMGEINNQFPYDFSEVYLWTGTTKVKLGALKSGEALKVDKKLQTDYLSRPYTSGSGYSMPRTKKGLEKLRKQRMEYSAMEFLYSQAGNDYQPIVYGYTKDSVITANIKEKKELRRASSMIYQTVDLEPITDGPFTIKDDLLQAEINTVRGAVYGDWQTSVANHELGIEDGEYDYVLQIPKNILAKKPNFQVLNITWYGRNVSYSLMNQKTGKFTPLSKQKTTINQQLDQYVSPEGKITIKLVKAGQGETQIKLPSVLLKGEIN